MSDPAQTMDMDMHPLVFDRLFMNECLLTNIRTVRHLLGYGAIEGIVSK